jgi:hypothetical protein
LQEERAMSLSRNSLLALGIALAGAVAPAGAQTQEDKWRKDLMPLVPPVVPLPPNSQLNPGSVGGASTPYTTAPLQNSTTQTPTQPAPGLRLTIPTR